MQRLVIHKVGVGSLGRLIGTWFAIVSVIVGVFAAVATNVQLFNTYHYSVIEGTLVVVLVSAAWVLLYPLVMFVVGWVNGAILALIFNFVVSGSGGLSVHVEETALDGTPAKK